MILLEPAGEITRQDAYAATLDGMERLAQQGTARYLTLREVQRLGRLDLPVTGASAVCTNGGPTGKSPRHLPPEGAVLRMPGVLPDETPVIPLVPHVRAVG